MRALLLAAILAMVGCDTSPKSRKERALVAFPEKWQDGAIEREYRTCFLDSPGEDSGFQSAGMARDIPKLDCDRFVKGEIVHTTPPMQIAEAQVNFSGKYSLGVETTWTCRQTQGWLGLDCRRPD